MIEDLIREQEEPEENVPYYDFINLTDSKTSEIKEVIKHHQMGKQYIIGNFLITMKCYRQNNKEESISVDLILWEKRPIIWNGRSCNIDYKLNLGKDFRFSGRTWVSQFNDCGMGEKISFSTMVEIVRWMQAITKMSAFL